MFELAEETTVQGAKIKVIGVGGAGGNAVNTMIQQWSVSGLDKILASGGIDFIAANTDLQALKSNRAPIKMQLGEALTRGLGAGADPEIGRKAAIESEAEITQMLEGADMIFITAGMGGGTGTGAAPVIARIARDLGALTIGVVTKPFSFEGKRRGRYAQEGLEALEESVDSLISIPNERLLVVAGKNMPLTDAFKMADEVLLNAVRGISDLILVDGLINLDFADIRTIMSTMGTTLMGSGSASGEHSANEAAMRAISSPLLENISIRGARGVILNVTGGPKLTLHQVNEAATLIKEESHEETNIIFGAVVDPSMDSEVRVTVIATGFERASRKVSEFVPYQNRRSEPVLEERETEPLSYAASQESLAEEVETVPAISRPKIPVPSNLKKMIGDFRSQDFVNRDVDGDEYDIPTFLRKHAD